MTVGVTVQAPTASQAMADNASRQQAVVDALKAQGVQARDIQTSGLNLSPVQDYSGEGKPPVITGYQAQNLVTVTVRDLARLGGALDALVAAGANEVNGISFAREDAQDAEDAARSDAVDSARHRAEVLAQAAGLRLGSLLTLTDTGADSRPPLPMMAMARDKAAGSTPVEAGELNVIAHVNATFALVGGDADAGIMDRCGMHGADARLHEQMHGMRGDMHRGKDGPAGKQPDGLQKRRDKGDKAERRRGDKAGSRAPGQGAITDRPADTDDRAPGSGSTYRTIAGRDRPPPTCRNNRWGDRTRVMEAGAAICSPRPVQRRGGARRRRHRSCVIPPRSAPDPDRR